MGRAQQQQQQQLVVTVEKNGGSLEFALHQPVRTTVAAPIACQARRGRSHGDAALWRNVTA